MSGPPSQQPTLEDLGDHAVAALEGVEIGHINPILTFEERREQRSARPAQVPGEHFATEDAIRRAATAASVRATI